MPFDLEEEIARRLNVSRDAIAPVLDAVIERIRQQVSHYGYARLAGLGTFRGQNGDIAFEPDPGLSEDVNLKYGGLEEVSVAAVLEEEGEGQEEGEAFETEGGGEEETVYGDSPGDDYERSDRDSDDEFALDDEHAVDDAGEPGDDAHEDVEDAYAPPPFAPTDIRESEEELEMRETTEPVDETPAPTREPFPWDEDDSDSDEPVEDDVPGVTWSDEDEDVKVDADLTEDVDLREGADSIEGEDLIDEEDLIEGSAGTVGAWQDEPDELDDDEMDEEDTWLARPDEDHPLGPVADGPFEEADYSVLEEQRDSDQARSDEEERPYVGDDLEEGMEDEEEFDDADMFEDADTFEVADTFEDADTFGDADAFGDDFAFDDADADELDAAYGADRDEVVGEDDYSEGPTVEWSPLDEPAESDRVAGEEAAMAAAAGGAASADDDAHEEEDSPEKASDHHALPHERIRQHPPRRHAAARASGGGAAGGNRSAIWIGVGVLVIVAAVAVVYFIITPTAPTNDEAIMEQPETPVPPDTAATAAADAAGADTTTSILPPPAEEEVEESTPLRSSEGIDASAGGFTIIVYSQTSPSGAEDAAARYRDEGFRTSVLEYQESGTTRYRVGVGQFTTLDEAVEAHEDLAGNELPDDAWVRRIR